MAILKNLITIGDATITNKLNVGSNNSIDGAGTSALGSYLTVEGQGAHAEGFRNKAIGESAHAEGGGTYAHGSRAHAEGDCTLAANTAHAEGVDTFAAWISHAEGRLSFATGQGAHAEGYYTIARTAGSHTEGYGVILDSFTQSSDNNNRTILNVISTAISTIDSKHELVVVVCSGIPALADMASVLNRTMIILFGSNTGFGISYMIPIKNASTSFDSGTSTFTICTSDDFLINNDLDPSILPYMRLNYLSQAASGEGAHAEGRDTVANGIAAHAEGISCVVDSANGAHALGYHTIANTNYVSVCGRYNLNTSAGDLFVIGNGTTNAARKNVFRVLEQNPNGNGGHDVSVFVSGDIVVSGKVNAATGFFQTSDATKKNIISDIDLNKAYQLVDKCQTIIYTLKDDKSNKEQIGMIALEIREFFPEIVEESSDGSLTLDYSRLTVIILRVLKDLIKKVDDITKNK